MKVLRTSITLMLVLSLLAGSAAVLQVVGEEPGLRPQEQRSSLPAPQPDPALSHDTNDDSCELPVAFASELEPVLREADRADALETVEQAIAAAPVDEVCKIVEYILGLLRCDPDEECCPGNTLECLLSTIERLIASVQRLVDDVTQYRPVEVSGHVTLEVPQVELEETIEAVEVDRVPPLVIVERPTVADPVVQEPEVIAVTQHGEPVEAQVVADTGPALLDPPSVAAVEQMETQEEATLAVTV